MKNLNSPPLFVRLDVPYEVLLDSGIDPGGALQFTAEEGKLTVEQLDEEFIFPCACARHCDKSKTENQPLEAFLDGLSPQDQYAALVHLTTRWAERRTGGTA